jgi:CheY-like chemotaxis protein
MSPVANAAIWSISRAAGYRSLRVLMVVDYEPGAQAVALALSFAGHEAQFAYGGKEAVRRLAFWIPDMAVLDINMPPPDGFELAASLRGSVAPRDVYIIAHTSRSW